MKKWPIAIVACLSFFAIAQCSEWRSSFEEAKREALRDGKKILLIFTIKPARQPSKNLKKIIDDPKSREVLKDYVLVNMEVVQDPSDMSPEQRKAVKKVVCDYDLLSQPMRFPAILITDEKGRSLALGNYADGATADDIVTLVKTIDALHHVVHMLMKAAERFPEDTQKAFMLSQALKLIESNVPLSGYGDVIDKIIEYDKDNVMGLKDYYLATTALADIRKDLYRNASKEVDRKANDFLSRFQKTEWAQLAFFYKGLAAVQEGRLKDAEECMVTALKINANSFQARAIRAALQEVQLREAEGQ